MGAFVEVRVEATGRVEMVPAEWVGHPVLGKGITPTGRDEASDPAPAPAPAASSAASSAGSSEVQLVAGDEDDLPIIPAARAAAMAARAEAAGEQGPVTDAGSDRGEVDGEPPTERSQVAEIDAYAEAHGIDLTGASTKAEKLAAIEASASQAADHAGEHAGEHDDTTQDPDGTEPSAENPPSGEEN